MSGYIVVLEFDIVEMVPILSPQPEEWNSLLCEVKGCI